MSKICLMANDYVGLEVAKFLIENGDKIEFLCIHEEDKQKLTTEIIHASRCEPDRIINARDVMLPMNLERIKNAEIDFIITVYWAYLLKPELFNLATKGTVNFHPALLPINRGWFPHVHSLIDGTPFGVTLHSLDEGADTGPVWVQKQVFPDETDNAGTVYKKLQEEIIQLFKDNWNKIRNNDITPIQQDHSKAIYRKKKDIENLDFIDLDNISGRQLINMLKARTFGNRGFAYFNSQDGKKIYMHLRLGYEQNFE
ncbi:MAG: hypothetical protein HW421_2758 [Ignavibacteria bacterium]|nr:hypothetical protein [Ignavibacteria bacterium]